MSAIAYRVAARHLSEQTKSAPKKVDDLFKEVKNDNPSYSDEQAWATAWSIYCKHVDPNGAHCNKAPSEYLKTAALDSFGAYIGGWMSSILGIIENRIARGLLQKGFRRQPLDHGQSDRRYLTFQRDKDEIDVAIHLSNNWHIEITASATLGGQYTEIYKDLCGYDESPRSLIEDLTKAVEAL